MTKKFDETSTQSPLTRTLSAFNELCLEVNSRLSPDESLKVYKKLTEEFGENFKTLSRVLPNILCFDRTSDRPASSLDDTVGNGLNYHSLCFTVQKFVRVISSTLIPVMIVLDDLQWSDPIR